MDSKWIGVPGPFTTVYLYLLGDDEKVWRCYHVDSSLRNAQSEYCSQPTYHNAIWFNKSWAYYRANSS